jgi:hypothetical protein
MMSKAELYGIAFSTGYCLYLGISRYAAPTMTIIEIQGTKNQKILKKPLTSIIITILFAVMERRKWSSAF